MSIETVFILAGFTSPIRLGTGPQSLLWMLPLIAAIAVVYKTTKLPKIKAGNFLKETVTLFVSIVIFIVITALILYAFDWLIIK